MIKTKVHNYKTTITWTGNTGKGTHDYKSYERSHTVSATNKPAVACSSDPAFRGDKSRYNPEELFVSALSGCHMLWYLHLCAVNGVVITEYVDGAEGEMIEHEDGSGEFDQVTLRPRVTVQDETMKALASQLHDKAHAMCFIARSVKCSVVVEPTITVGR